jgi:hypothetical protein
MLRSEDEVLDVDREMFIFHRWITLVTGYAHGIINVLTQVRDLL